MMTLQKEPSVENINRLVAIDPPLPKTFGEHVRAKRRDAGITQRELAKIVGTDFTYISKIENDRLDGVVPSEELIRTIARALAWDEEEALRLTDRFDWKAEAKRLQACLNTSDSQEAIWAEIRQERQRQDHTWGEQNHDHFVWLAILTEEVGEAAQAMLVEALAEKPSTHIRQEIIQMAAVCIAWLECLDRNK